VDSLGKHGPSFEKKVVSWILQTYQLLSASEQPSLRENMKAPNVGVYKVQSILSTKCANLMVKLHGFLQGKAVSITTDTWTSCNTITFITCKAHFIDPKTWLLHHIPLGLFQKSGTSHAEDVVQYVEGIWER
jgi:hypothetical protein